MPAHYLKIQLEVKHATTVPQHTAIVLKKSQSTSKYRHSTSKWYHDCFLPHLIIRCHVVWATGSALNNKKHQHVLDLKKRNQRTDIHTLPLGSSKTLRQSTPALDIPTLRQNLTQMLNMSIRNTLLSVTSDCKQTNNQEQPRVSIWPQSHSTWLNKIVALPNLRVSSVTNFGPQLSTAVWTYTQQSQHDTVLSCTADVGPM